MKGKLMVMTIITGVTSPWIVGRQQVKQTKKAEIEDTLGIELIN
jgi:hypothetical protein